MLCGLDFCGCFCSPSPANTEGVLLSSLCATCGSPQAFHRGRGKQARSRQGYTEDSYLKARVSQANTLQTRAQNGRLLSTATCRIPIQITGFFKVSPEAPRAQALPREVTSLRTKIPGPRHPAQESGLGAQGPLGESVSHPGSPSRTSPVSSPTR